MLYWGREDNMLKSVSGLEFREYQKDGFEFIYDWMAQSKEIAGTGLFASVGAGKTAISIHAIERLLAEGISKHILILGPVRVIYDTWPKEFADWSPKLKYKIIHGQRKLDSQRAPIELQSIDSVHKLVEYAGRWDTLIVDESRNFAAWTRRRMKSLRKILPTIKRRCILTGTPTPESYTDLHGQMFITDDGEALGKTVTYFRTQFCERGGWMGRQWKFRKECEQAILGKVARRVMRIDATTHPDFPKLIENDIWVPMPANIKAEYNRLKRELAVELDREDGPINLMVGHAGALYQKLKQFACGQVYVGSEEEGTRGSEIVHGEKMGALDDLISELYEKPMIIIYQYKHDKDRIVAHLKGRKVGVIDSKTGAADATKIITKWNKRQLDFLVSHVKCLGEGLNLQFGGADMALYGLPDACNLYLQVRGRLWRPGQVEGEARIHRFMMRDTVEALQLDRLNGKIKGQDDFLDKLKKHVRVR